ncbi:hypothetical protein OESDEN_21365 [Oesophagostomum dentatum]|uniref:Uncharacterized protein n=1 Tax=Oesophagostomum dentatum TaxID=61180 RepID=A0A0B1S242_OESDE|nr:hypothetical protein OESDEN_21365 [Oesophagostomum dentatum]
MLFLANIHRLSSQEVKLLHETTKFMEFRLESDCGDFESVVMVKLTDEMFSALMLAQRKGLPIRVHIDEQGGKWELGDPANGGNVFRYQQQALPGPPTDAVVHDPRSESYRAVAAFRSKYQPTANSII